MTTRHEILVARLLKKYRAERGSVLKSFAKIEGIDIENISVDERTIKYAPDAHLIDAELKTVTIWEVEVCSCVKQHQAYAISEMQLELDYWGYKLEVYIVDRYGNESRVYPGGSFLNNTAKLICKEEYDAWEKSLDSKSYDKIAGRERQGLTTHQKSD